MLNDIPHVDLSSYLEIAEQAPIVIQLPLADEIESLIIKLDGEWVLVINEKAAPMNE